MKKLLFLLLSLGLLLGACSNEDKEAVAEPDKEQTGSESVIEEKDNELTFELNGEKKTVPAKTQSLQMVANEIKVSDKFELVQDPNGGLNFLGTGSLENVGFGVREEEKLGSSAGYETQMLLVAGNEGNSEKFEHPLLTEEYVVSLQGEGSEKKAFLLIKESNEKLLYITITMFKPIPENEDELLAEIIAMLNTIK
nr:hypothetical protein [Fredinandcohnia onubensis]